MTHAGFYIKHGSNWAGPFSDIEQAGKIAELSGWKIAEIIWMKDDDDRLKERERATELEFFKWMFVNLNLGAAHSTVMDMMKECFMDATGKNIPEGWNRGQSGETSLDRKERHERQ